MSFSPRRDAGGGNAGIRHELERAEEDKKAEGDPGGDAAGLARIEEDSRDRPRSRREGEADRGAAESREDEAAGDDRAQGLAVAE